MINKTSSIFMKDETDNRTKVICVFDANASDEDMIKVISEYLEENEMDEEDNEYATIVSKEDCYNEAYKIVKGEMLDLDLDRYWLEKNVTMYIK